MSILYSSQRLFTYYAIVSMSALDFGVPHGPTMLSLTGWGREGGGRYNPGMPDGQSSLTYYIYALLKRLKENYLYKLSVGGSISLQDIPVAQWFALSSRLWVPLLFYTEKTTYGYEN